MGFLLLFYPLVIKMDPWRSLVCQALPSILLEVPPILRGASLPLIPFGHPRYSGGGRPRSQYSSVALVTQPCTVDPNLGWQRPRPSLSTVCVSVMDRPRSSTSPRRSALVVGRPFPRSSPGKAHASGALRCHSARRCYARRPFDGVILIDFSSKFRSSPCAISYTAAGVNFPVPIGPGDFPS